MFDKDIPIPDIARAIREPFSRFAGMEIGESMFAPIERAQATRNAVSSFAKRSGRKFTVRKVEGGVRVWRTE